MLSEHELGGLISKSFILQRGRGEGVGDPESVTYPGIHSIPWGPDHSYCAVPCWLRAASRAIKASGCSHGGCYSDTAFFPHLFFLEAWSLSLIIQLLRVLKLFNWRLGHWIPVLSSSSHSWASADSKWCLTIPSFRPAVWTSISNPQTGHTLSLWGPLHMRFSLPWISFFALIIPIHPSGSRWNIPSSRKPSTLPVCVSSACMISILLCTSFHL